MKKQICLFGLVITFFFTFCKKKEDSPAPAPATNTTTTTGGNPFAYSDMYTTYTYFDYNGSVTVDSSVTAQFYLGSNSSGPPTNVSAGNVSFNSVNLNVQPDNAYTNANPNLLPISGILNWNVAGTGTVTAFSYSYTASYPQYTGANLLPDTCILANGISINVNGLSNYFAPQLLSGLTVTLIQNNVVSKPIFGTSGGTVSFSASELSGFSINTPITIMVSIINFNSVVINSVNRNFNCGLVYQKIAYLK